MAMTSGRKARPPNDHRSRPDKRARIGRNAHTSTFRHDEQSAHLSQYIQDALSIGMLISIVCDSLLGRRVPQSALLRLARDRGKRNPVAIIHTKPGKRVAGSK